MSSPARSLCAPAAERRCSMSRLRRCSFSPSAARVATTRCPHCAMPRSTAPPKPHIKVVTNVAVAVLSTKSSMSPGAVFGALNSNCRSWAASDAGSAPARCEMPRAMAVAINIQPTSFTPASMPSHMSARRPDAEDGSSGFRPASPPSTLECAVLPDDV